MNISQLGRGNLRQADLDEILIGLSDHWNKFSNKKILILGATGFFGRWLCSALLEANEKFNLKLEVFAYVRNAQRAKNDLNIRSSDGITFEECDFSIESVDFPEADFIIHAATPTSIDRKLGIDVFTSPSIGAAKSIANLCVKTSKKINIVHLSSGSVYKESLSGNPNKESDFLKKIENADPYTKTKLNLEKILQDCTKNKNIKIANPRLFTFAGPYLPINKHFAIGNFLNNAMRGESIDIYGNINTIRSYMYPSQAVIWILRILLEPIDIPLNIGSEEPIDMLSLATRIAEKFPNLSVQYDDSEKPISLYWPNTLNTRKIYGVSDDVCLDEIIERWIDWFRLIQRHDVNF